MMQNTKDAMARIRASSGGTSRRGPCNKGINRLFGLERDFVEESMKARMSSLNHTTPKSSTESIYTESVLEIITEANRNSQKTNSRYRYLLDEKVYGSYDVHIRVFDVTSEEWLDPPWTMKKFLGKHSVLKERVQQNRAYRDGALSARAPRSKYPTTTKNVGNKINEETHCGRITNRQLMGPYSAREYVPKNAKIGHSELPPREHSRFSLGMARNRSPSPSYSSPRKVPKHADLRSELEHIESLCRGVSRQVKLAREIT